MKTVLVCGAGGFIGNHLVNYLKSKDNYVIGVDLKYPEFSNSQADEFEIVDLRNQYAVSKLFTKNIDDIYQLAADMGGAGYVFTGDNDANILHNSAQINLNILSSMINRNIQNIFYSSSACIYPEHNQTNLENLNCEESSAYPANPDSEYGWEKLFSERIYMSFAKNYGIKARIARLHNVFGPLGSYNNGKEKAPAAICRKIAESKNNGTIDIWGNGEQTRSFLYIDECLVGIEKIMASNYSFPLNLGSDRMISINNLVRLISEISGKTIYINNINGPTGVNHRNSNNSLIKQVTGWAPENKLEYGLKKTYDWIKTLVCENQ